MTARVSYDIRGTMKILFIEDDPFAIEITQSGLEEHNHTVTLAKCVKEAFTALTDGEYDLIICDHQFPFWPNHHPESNAGLEVYRSILHLDRFAKHRETPFLHFSFAPCPSKYPSSDIDFYSIPKGKEDSLERLLKLIRNLERLNS